VDMNYAYELRDVKKSEGLQESLTDKGFTYHGTSEVRASGNTTSYSGPSITASKGLMTQEKEEV